MVFLKVKNEQLNIVLDLLKKSSIELNAKGLDQWGYWRNPPQERIEWIKSGISNNEFYFVRNSENELIGMFRLLYEDLLYWGKQEKKAGYVHSLVIKKEYKGQNLGKQVMEQIKGLLVKKEIHLIRLDCVSNNEGLCSYYESLGFKKVGQIQMPLSLNNLYEKKLK